MNYRKKLLLSITWLACAAVLAACGMQAPEMGINNQADRLNASTVQPVQTGVEKKGPAEAEVVQPLKSGETTSVPWESDGEFLKARERVGANVLMGAYRTVLKDPLPGEEENVHLAARMLAGTILNPGEVFSQNGKVGPYTEDRGFKRGPTYVGSQLTTTIGGGVCKIASTLYNVAILSNLQIVERHAHGMPVPYVPYGQDATVAYGARDIKFKNNTDSPVLIWAQGVDNVLYIGFYGRSTPPKVEWHHEVLEVRKAPVIYRKNPSLKPGEEKKALEGMDGAVVKSWLTIYMPDGSTMTRELGLSNYRPMAHIVERSE